MAATLCGAIDIRCSLSIDNSLFVLSGMGGINLGLIPPLALQVDRIVHGCVLPMALHGLQEVHFKRGRTLGE